ncbi:MAG: hypothetical protein QG602_632 [Verrucomicrobiota bacterium]|nr:hypothetical protein [Verrucomicrobiota bacterium]
MKLLLLALLGSGLLLATGCTDSQAHPADTKPVAASSYKAGHGVQLSPAAARFAGLVTAEFTGRLPADALLRTAKGDFVYVANGPWLLRTPVTAQGDNLAGFTVSAGLYEGDVIATQGVRVLWLAELQAINGGVGCADGH